MATTNASLLALQKQRREAERKKENLTLESTKRIGSKKIGGLFVGETDPTTGKRREVFQQAESKGAIKPLVPSGTQAGTTGAGGVTTYDSPGKIPEGQSGLVNGVKWRRIEGKLVKEGDTFVSQETKEIQDLRKLTEESEDIKTSAVERDIADARAALIKQEAEAKDRTARAEGGVTAAFAQGRDGAVVAARPEIAGQFQEGLQSQLQTMVSQIESREAGLNDLERNIEIAAEAGDIERTQKLREALDVEKQVLEQEREDREALLQESEDRTLEANSSFMTFASGLGLEELAKLPTSTLSSLATSFGTDSATALALGGIGQAFADAKSDEEKEAASGLLGNLFGDIEAKNRTTQQKNLSTILGINDLVTQGKITQAEADKLKQEAGITEQEEQVSELDRLDAEEKRIDIAKKKEELLSARGEDGELKEVPRLQDTQNIANDFNNPGNLRPGGVGDDFAIGKTTVTQYNTDGTPFQGEFLVFENVDDGKQAQEADITAKLTGGSRYVKPTDTLESMLNTYANNPPQGYIDTVISQLKQSDQAITKDTKVSDLSSIPKEVSKAIQKAEGFEGGNDLYKGFARSGGDTNVLTVPANTADFTSEQNAFMVFGADPTKLPATVDKTSPRQVAEFKRKADAFNVKVRDKTREFDLYKNLFLTNTPMGVGVSDADVERKIKALTDAMLEGDTDEVKRVTRTAVLGEDKSSNWDDFNILDIRLDTVQGLLDDLSDEGTDTNFGKGTLESTINAIGETTNPTLAALKTNLDLILTDYIKATSGTAVTDTERQFLRQILPQIINDPTLNKIKLDTFRDSIVLKRDQPLKERLGDKRFGLLFGKDAGPEPKIDITTPEGAAKFLEDFEAGDLTEEDQAEIDSIYS